MVAMVKGRVNLFRLCKVAKLREVVAVEEDTLLDTEGHPNTLQFGCSLDTGKIQY